MEYLTLVKTPPKACVSAGAFSPAGIRAKKDEEKKP